MTDREHIRREAEVFMSSDVYPHGRLARFCLELLAELEQAERERDEAKRRLSAWVQKSIRDDLQLAAVPVLVEALRYARTWIPQEADSTVIDEALTRYEAQK